MAVHFQCASSERRQVSACYIASSLQQCVVLDLVITYLNYLQNYQGLNNTHISFHKKIGIR